MTPGENTAAGRPGGRSRDVPFVVGVTRPPPAGQELARLLERLGFEVLVCPTLAIAPAPDLEALVEAAARSVAGHYHWTVFTSRNAVSAFASALREVGPGVTSPDTGIAVVGAATAEASRRQGWSVDRIAGTSTAEGLLAEFEPVLNGTRVLFPAAEGARDVLPLGLRARGADVDVVVAYRSGAPPDAAAWREAVASGAIDVLTFASPSSARNLLEAAGDRALEIPAVVIGPVTADAARALGFRVVGVAERPSTEGLADAVAAWAIGKA